MKAKAKTSIRCSGNKGFIRMILKWQRKWMSLNGAAVHQDLVITKAQATVTRKQSGISRGYRAGDDGTTWVVDFEKDLREGVFR